MSKVFDLKYNIFRNIFLFHFGGLWERGYEKNKGEIKGKG